MIPNAYQRLEVLGKARGGSVGKSADGNPEVMTKPLRRPSRNRGHQEKRRFGVQRVTVLKPTQVGEASSLRRSREPRKRNSAKWFRNLGIRIAFGHMGTCSSEGLEAAVNRLKRLFSKNTGLC